MASGLSYLRSYSSLQVEKVRGFSLPVNIIDRISMFCACHHCHVPTVINMKEKKNERVSTVFIVLVRDLIQILPNLLYKTYTNGYEIFLFQSLKINYLLSFLNLNCFRINIFKECFISFYFIHFQSKKLTWSEIQKL